MPISVIASIIAAMGAAGLQPKNRFRPNSTARGRIGVEIHLIPGITQHSKNPMKKAAPIRSACLA